MRDQLERYASNTGAKLARPRLLQPSDRPAAGSGANGLALLDYEAQPGVPAAQAAQVLRALADLAVLRADAGPVLAAITIARAPLGAVRVESPFAD